MRFGNSDTVLAYNGCECAVNKRSQLPCSHEVLPAGASRPHTQDNIIYAGVGVTEVCCHDFVLSMTEILRYRQIEIYQQVSSGSLLYFMILNLFAPGPGGLVRRSNAETNIPPTVRADYNIYYHKLLAKQRGSPMWIPGPDMNLPTEYRREGTRIGDVGILYCSEGFSFLFNIFFPAEHAINEGRVPPGFEPLNLSNPRHRPKKQVVFGPKSYLTSTSVTTSSNMDTSYVSRFHDVEDAHDSVPAI